MRRSLGPSAFASGGCNSIGRPSRIRGQLTEMKYCCPVKGPDWASRGRLRIFPATAIQARWSSCVIPWLWLQAFTAVLKAARQRNCAGVFGSRGFL